MDIAHTNIRNDPFWTPIVMINKTAYIFTERLYYRILIHKKYLKKIASLIFLFTKEYIC